MCVCVYVCADSTSCRANGNWQTSLYYSYTIDDCVWVYSIHVARRSFIRVNMIIIMTVSPIESGGIYDVCTSCNTHIVH